MMYAAGGVGYAASGSLGGAVQAVASASAAILAGAALTVLLTVVGAFGELFRRRGSSVMSNHTTSAVPTE